MRKVRILAIEKRRLTISQEDGIGGGQKGASESILVQRSLLLRRLRFNLTSVFSFDLMLIHMWIDKARVLCFRSVFVCNKNERSIYYYFEYI